MPRPKSPMPAISSLWKAIPRTRGIPADVGLFSAQTQTVRRQQILTRRHGLVATATEYYRVPGLTNRYFYPYIQVVEQARFIVLLDVLCQLVRQPAQEKGRPL